MHLGCGHRLKCYVASADPFLGALGDLDESFALVLAVEHSDECPRSVLQAFGDVLTPADVSVRHPVRESEGRFVVAVCVIEDEEALHSRAEHDQQTWMERR